MRIFFKKKTKQSSYPTGSLNYMGWVSWPYGWASFHVGIFMSVVSSTSGRLPKENVQIQSGEHRPLGGNPAVNLTQYIWQPVAYLKNNLSWAVVSTSWNRAAGCSVSRELLVVCFTGRLHPLKLQSETALQQSPSKLLPQQVTDSVQGQIFQQSVWHAKGPLYLQSGSKK